MQDRIKDGDCQLNCATVDVLVVALVARYNSTTHACVAQISGANCVVAAHLTEKLQLLCISDAICAKHCVTSRYEITGTTYFVFVESETPVAPLDSHGDGRPSTAQRE